MAKNNTAKRILSFFIIILFIGGVAFFYFWFYFPFSDNGVKAGILNNIKHKGIIFKTYEGELIQTGFGTDMKQGAIQSNEFQFSVQDKEVADKLMQLSGQQVKLHYKEYYHALPWRGYSKFVVDSIIESIPINNESVKQLEQNSIPSTTNEENSEELFSEIDA